MKAPFQPVADENDPHFHHEWYQGNNNFIQNSIWLPELKCLRQCKFILITNFQLSTLFLEKFSMIE